MADKKVLNRDRVRALYALLTANVNDNKETIARRAGISQPTLYRYLQEENFLLAYRQHLVAMANQYSGPMLMALIDGGIQRGPGQASMQRLYWELIGGINKGRGVSDGLGLTPGSGVGSGSSESKSNEQIDLDLLPPFVRKLLYVVSKGGAINADLVSRLNQELDRAISIGSSGLDILPEYVVEDVEQEREERLIASDNESEGIVREIMEMIKREVKAEVKEEMARESGDRTGDMTNTNEIEMRAKKRKNKEAITEVEARKLGKRLTMNNNGTVMGRVVPKRDR